MRSFVSCCAALLVFACGSQATAQCCGTPIISSTPMVMATPVMSYAPIQAGPAYVSNCCPSTPIVGTRIFRGRQWNNCCPAPQMGCCPAPVSTCWTPPAVSCCSTAVISSCCPVNTGQCCGTPIAHVSYANPISNCGCGDIVYGTQPAMNMTIQPATGEPVPVQPQPSGETIKIDNAKEVSPPIPDDK